MVALEAQQVLCACSVRHKLKMHQAACSMQTLGRHGRCSLMQGPTRVHNDIPGASRPTFSADLGPHSLLQLLGGLLLAGDLAVQLLAHLQAVGAASSARRLSRNRC